MVSQLGIKINDVLGAFPPPESNPQIENYCAEDQQEADRAELMDAPYWVQNTRAALICSNHFSSVQNPAKAINAKTSTPSTMRVVERMRHRSVAVLCLSEP